MVVNRNRKVENPDQTIDFVSKKNKSIEKDLRLQEKFNPQNLNNRRDLNRKLMHRTQNEISVKEVGIDIKKLEVKKDE